MDVCVCVILNVPHKNINAWTDFNKLSAHFSYDVGTNTMGVYNTITCGGRR